MNISESLLLPLLGGVAFFLLGATILLFKLYQNTNNLRKSFAKLGYTNREDAKKYFEDAAAKVVEMNSSFYQQYQKMIEDGSRVVLAESGKTMEGAIVQAQQDAGKIILKAQQDGQHIIETAKQESGEYFNRAISDSVSAIEWTMEQYLKEYFDVHQHETVISKLLDTYIDERRSK